MCFEYNKITIELQDGLRKSSHVWSRNSGYLVIVVIDDECNAASKPPDYVSTDVKIFPLLCEHARELSETRAIGFFPLAKDEVGADKVLKFVQEWLGNVGKSIKVRFLVDIGGPEDTEVAAPYTVEQLLKPPFSYSRNQIAYFTKSGGHTIRPTIEDFIKANEAVYIEAGQFSSKLMSFFGIGMHEDQIINDTLQFYAKAWEVGWKKNGWDHDELEKKDSVHLETLADWLGDSISVDDLYDWEDGESAKSLMIWVGRHHWGDARPIQGKVLKAVMEKLKTPLSETVPVPEEPINMPCTPCLPFLISLRSFLLCCEEFETPVSKIRFFQNDEHCNFRLILQKPLRNLDRLKNRYYKMKKEDVKSLRYEHPLTRSLIELTYCITNGLPKDTGRDYMHLFTEGTGKPFVEVKEIAKDYIDLLW